jgi:hypothetical protein
MDAGSTPPKGVVNPQLLDFYVGDPPRQMLIFTGTAEPEWDSHGNLDKEEAIVRLGVLTTDHYRWTSMVALASIGNEDTDFTFATDASWVDTDPDTAELCLHVDLATQGDVSILHRFSYHVQVLSDTVHASISGHIRWSEAFGGPSLAAQQGDPMFRVTAGNTIELPPDGSGFRHWRFVPVADGFSTATAIQGGGQWAIPYEIRGVPLGRPVEVIPALLAGMLAGPPSGYDAAPRFAPAPWNVELTPAAPSAVGKDFVMSFEGHNR